MSKKQRKDYEIIPECSNKQQKKDQTIK